MFIDRQINKNRGAQLSLTDLHWRSLTWEYPLIWSPKQLGNWFVIRLTWCYHDSKCQKFLKEVCGHFCITSEIRTKHPRSSEWFCSSKYLIFIYNRIFTISLQIILYLKYYLFGRFKIWWFGERSPKIFRFLLWKINILFSFHILMMITFYFIHIWMNHQNMQKCAPCNK